MTMTNQELAFIIKQFISVEIISQEDDTVMCAINTPGSSRFTVRINLSDLKTRPKSAIKAFEDYLDSQIQLPHGDQAVQKMQEKISNKP